VQLATGEAARFVSVYNEYVKAPEVTRERLYLETMEQVIASSNKVVVQPGASGANGILPYLPLPSLQPRPAEPDNSSSSAPQGTAVTTGSN
jgi:membrane protease subunit HflK